MVNKSKEVQGLLYKVAEVESILIMLVAMLDAKGVVDKADIESIFAVAEIPEILTARIKRILEQGEEMIEARKKAISEMLGLEDLPHQQKEPIEEVVDEKDTRAVRDPDEKLH